MAYFKPKMLEARIYVGSKGDFETLKEAVDWFNANATANTEILLDGGDHLINDTVTVNNGSYYLQIRGLGSSVTYLNAATVGGTALTGKPMFDLRTDCDMNKFSAQAATLSGNLQTNQNGQNINIALRKNNSTIISPLTVRAQSAGVPYGFAVTAYLEDVKMGDYFEVVVANTSSAGRTVTLQDMTMFFNAR